MLVWVVLEGVGLVGIDMGLVGVCVPNGEGR